MLIKKQEKRQKTNKTLSSNEPKTSLGCFIFTASPTALGATVYHILLSRQFYLQMSTYDLLALQYHSHRISVTQGSSRTSEN